MGMLIKVGIVLIVSMTMLGNVIAKPLAQAEVMIQILLVQPPTSRPMVIAYEPQKQVYVIVDGGFAPMTDPNTGIVESKSLTHSYDRQGHYLGSVKTGLNNASVYYRTDLHRLEVVTHNVSSAVGFFPNTGIFALKTEAPGKVLSDTDNLTGVNPAFGESGTMPSMDDEHRLYYAKQEKSNIVRLIDRSNQKLVGELALDLKSADTLVDNISEHWVGYTGMPGAELVLLDVDNKAALLFNLKGNFVGKSALPPHLRLYAKNHYSGYGYTNGLFFVYYEREGQFGSYYGFRIFEQ